MTLKKRRIHKYVVWSLILFFAYQWLSHKFPNMFEIGGDDYIEIYPSSTIFFYGDEGRVSGGGRLGQYNATGGGSGGCCKSSELRAYLGTPKGEIAVSWQAIYEHPEISKFYYAYHPNPEIPIPPKGIHHNEYIIFYSFGQLALRKEALTKDQLDSPTFFINPGKIGYQVGQANTFYYKVYSDSDHAFSTNGIRLESAEQAAELITKACLRYSICAQEKPLV